jgi:hypothetical protein
VASERRSKEGGFTKEDTERARRDGRQDAMVEEGFFAALRMTVLGVQMALVKMLGA